MGCRAGPCGGDNRKGDRETEGRDKIAKTAIIIGAGPAGLTAAYELLERTDIRPVVYEMSGDIGGISKTVNYKGNRIDIGGHRFFSKSDWVMQWWRRVLPMQGAPSVDDMLPGRNFIPPCASGPEGSCKDAPDPEKTDKVMLVRSRLSRIFFLGRFFDYPLSLSKKTFLNLGPVRVLRIAVSYARARLWPIRDEKSLEDFFINRFGRELYLTFFKDYTEKVWGVPCDRIKPEWGAQRIKGLSITKAVLHAINRLVSTSTSIEQKNLETSLIEQFMYPKLGPGQLWEEVARMVREKGGEIHLRRRVTGMKCEGIRVTAAEVVDVDTGRKTLAGGDYFFSTMPVKDLIRAFDDAAPPDVRQVAEGLVYRDFITVGLLLRKLKMKNETQVATMNGIVPDNWVYIQERDVKIGRLQIFNNWSPYMVGDKNNVWLGLEYFCNEGDELWRKPDADFAGFAIDELSRLGFIAKEDVIDSVVIRMPKTYPAYFGSYDKFGAVRDFTDGLENLFLVGRNGMHRYNNQDHSMLTAKTAVDNIISGVKTKDNIWDVNTEQEYHENK